MTDKPDYSEAEIVRGCLDNDRYFQEMLYRQHAPVMFRMVMRYTSDQELAKELVNSGFLRAFQKLDTFSFKGSLQGWIRKIVFHSVSDHFRRKPAPVHFLEVEDRQVPMDDTILSKLYLEDLLDLANKLPEATRRVFFLYAVEGYTHPEIGKKLDISTGTSKWHLSNARKQLKQWIRKQYSHAI